MNKQILEDYIDVCEFIRESEARIRRLESKKRVVMDKVHGSNPDFPYEERSFSLVGTEETPKDAYELSMEKKLLEEQKAEAGRLKAEVDTWMKTIPYRMQRIIRYHVFEGLTWSETAEKMGKNSTENSLKKEYQRFLEKSKVCHECHTCHEKIC